MDDNAAIKGLVQDTMSSCYEYFGRLIPCLEKIIEGISDAPENHLLNLSEACDGIAWMTKAFFNTSNYYYIEIDYESVEKTLKNVCDGLKNRDYIFIAETLEYEMLPMLTKWFETLEKDFGDNKK